MSSIHTLERVFRYKAQSNREILAAMEQFDEDSPAQEIALRIIHHTYIVDRIFAAHMTGTGHRYTSPNTVDVPALAQLSRSVGESDQSYIDYVVRLDEPQLAEVIDFTFTDGAPGRMSREEMLMHLTIHGAGHRGQVAWIMTENAITPAADGLTSYLHQAEAAARRRGGSPGGAVAGHPGASPTAAPVHAVQGSAAPAQDRNVMSRLKELTDRMRVAAGADSGLGKTLKFNLKGEGFIHIDGQSVTNEDRPADLTLTATIDDLRAIGQGRLTPMSAIMSGRLRLSNMGVAVGLQDRLRALFSRMPPARAG
jgi:uncharacterized damage-inducible protein DinB/putative sterol carrier protein